MSILSKVLGDHSGLKIKKESVGLYSLTNKEGRVLYMGSKDDCVTMKKKTIAGDSIFASS
ncbi:MAG: hypothetical protein JXQ90_05285 [Cyclobacteriaceae bacterium]